VKIAIFSSAVYRVGVAISGIVDTTLKTEAETEQFETYNANR